MSDTSSVAESMSLDAQFPDIESSGKAFKFQGQKLLLTWSEQVEKEALHDHLIEEIGFRPKFLRSAHEVGATGHEHTHTLIDFGKKVNYTKCDKFDFSCVFEGEDVVKTLHPNWRPIKTATHWKNAVRYLGKEDADNADLMEEEPNLIQAIWAAPTRAEAVLRYAKTPAMAQAVITTYSARPSAQNAPRPPPDAWHPWQTEVIDLLKTYPDDRSVHWFFDPEGGAGKSRLAKWLVTEGLAYMVRCTGGDRDFATIVRGAIADGWDQRCMIFDLPRVSEAHAIYGPIEACKDGTVTATKYEGGTITFDSPHVLIFANFLPDCGKLSKDRWRIHRITEDKTLDRPIFTGRVVDTPSFGKGALNINRAPPVVSEEPRKDNVAKAVSADWFEEYL